jgi:hypothetical protein
MKRAQRRLFNYFVLVSETGAGKFIGAQIVRTAVGCSWGDIGSNAQYFAGTYRAGEGVERWDVREERAIVFKNAAFARLTMLRIAQMAARSFR